MAEKSQEKPSVGSALADAFGGVCVLGPGLPHEIPENASAKADPTNSVLPPHLPVALETCGARVCPQKMQYWSLASG